MAPKVNGEADAAGPEVVAVGAGLAWDREAREPNGEAVAAVPGWSEPNVMVGAAEEEVDSAGFAPNVNGAVAEICIIHFF